MARLSSAMPDPTVRFAAGSAERIRSSVWRLWVHGSDVYLAARIMARTFKLSLHESGKWVSAFTEQSGVVLSETGYRRHREWQRPSEFRPGWTQGPSVMVPWVTWRDELPLRHEQIPADTEWVPEPKRNKKLLFNLLFSAADVTETASAVSRPGDRLLDRSLPLSNGELLWLQVRQTEMIPEDRAWIKSVSKEINVHHTGDVKSFSAAVIGIAEAKEQKVPMLVQFPLGRRHFRQQPKDEQQKGLLT